MHEGAPGDLTGDVLGDEHHPVPHLHGIGVADPVGRGQRARRAVRGADVEPALVARRGRDDPDLALRGPDQPPGAAAVLVDPGPRVQGRGRLDDPAVGVAAHHGHPAPLGGTALGPPRTPLPVEGDGGQPQCRRGDGVGGER